MTTTPTRARLVVAPDAATRLAAAAAWLAGYPPDAPLLLLGPGREAVDDLARRSARDAGARFGLVRATLERLAGRLALPELARRGRTPASRLALAAVAARAVHHLLADDALGYFAPVAARPGFATAATRTLEELRMNGVGAERLSGLPASGADLARLFRRIEEELDRAGHADRALVFAAAVDAVEAPAAADVVGLPLLLLDLPVASAAEAALLAALARRAPAILATAVEGDERAIAGLERTLGCAAERPAGPPRTGSLAALQTHLFRDSAPAPGPLDESVVLRSWPGEARECVEIARAIRAEAARGVPFDEMAVLLHAPAGYTAHLEEALERAEIPAVFARGTTRPHPAGRALLALLACRVEGLSAKRFAEYLSLAQVPDAPPPPAAGADWVPPDDEILATGPAPPEPPPVADAPPAGPPDPDEAQAVAGTLRAPWRWEALLVDAAVIGGAERWRERLAGLERELERQRASLETEEEARARALARRLADLRHLATYALPLVDALAALPAAASWDEWLEHLRALARRALREPDAVLATLAELAPMAPVGPVELDEVHLVLGPRLRDLPVPPPARRYGAVLVAPTATARGLAFEVVFVPGLAERIFPNKVVEDPMLPDAARRALDVPALARQETRAAAERLALGLAVGAARRRVVLSWPRMDVEQARPRVPSFYALEVLRAAEGKLAGFEELAARAEAAADARLGWPAPARPEDAIDEAEYDLALIAPLRAAPERAAPGTAHYLLGANPHLARALRARARRWIKRWTPADGLVDPGEEARAALARHQLAARGYSPTALQHFAACPYRFFLYAVHRLQPREEPIAIEQLDPLTRGSLFHDVQFAALTRLKAAGLLPVGPAGLDAALAIVDGATDEVAERYRRELAPAIPRVWDAGIGAIRADLREWIRRAAEADDGWTPYRFELAFGITDRDRTYEDPASVPDPALVLGRLRLRGSIDLVERHPEGRLRATDHKTGRPWAKEGVVVGGGQILQPALYALACEQLLDEPVDGGRLYYCTATGGYVERNVPLDDVARDHAATVVDAIDAALAAGFLPAAPVPGGCDFCDYRRVCGPHEEVRTRPKPADRLADLARLRALP